MPYSLQRALLPRFSCNRSTSDGFTTVVMGCVNGRRRGGVSARHQHYGYYMAKWRPVDARTKFCRLQFRWPQVPVWSDFVGDNPSFACTMRRTTATGSNESTLFDRRISTKWPSFGLQRKKSSRQLWGRLVLTVVVLGGIRYSVGPPLAKTQRQKLS